MHPNPAFRKEDRARDIALLRDRAFGMLTLAGPDGPLISHVPALVSEDGAQAHLHLVRSNPILRALDTPQPAVFAVQGALDVAAANAKRWRTVRLRFRTDCLGTH